MPDLLRWLPLLLLGTLAGCADSIVRRADDARLSEALLRLADLALTTADSDADIREVLRHGVQGVRGHQVAFIAGHRFLVAPATLDRTGADLRHRTLIAQSFELAEDSCLVFRPARAIDAFRRVAGGDGSVTLTVQADRRQFVNVGIEVREGCIVAMHFEQASAAARE